MKAIKNYESFKKSLLSSTNGTMVESFDSSNIFGGCEYQSYRIYVDDVHYYNMFVIHNFATNTYDVSLETLNRAVSTISRVVKTQKAMIESASRWCYYSYLNTKEISIDSEEYTDRCEETEKHYADFTSEDCIKAGIAKECARGNDVFDGCKRLHYMTDDCTKTVLNMVELFSQMFGNAIRGKCKMYNNSSYGCPADRQGNRCSSAQLCKQTWKRYAAIINPEWHHVSLATLANIDFDMLDEKRKLVCDINQILKDGIRNLYKCDNHISFEVLERYVIRKCGELIRHNRLKAFWFSYIARQLDEVRRNTIYLYTPYITAHRNRG